MSKFELLCAESGICDFFYIKRNKRNKVINNKPPIWMNKTEGKYWYIGFAYAKEQCIDNITNRRRIN